MGKKNSVVIRVAPSMANKLRKEWEEFNQNVSRKYFKKDISFTDYTDLVSGKTSFKEVFKKNGKRKITNPFDTLGFFG